MSPGLRELVARVVDDGAIGDIERGSVGRESPEAYVPSIAAVERILEHDPDRSVGRLGDVAGELISGGVGIDQDFACARAAVRIEDPQLGRGQITVTARGVVVAPRYREATVGEGRNDVIQLVARCIDVDEGLGPPFAHGHRSPPCFVPPYVTVACVEWQ